LVKKSSAYKKEDGLVTVRIKLSADIARHRAKLLRHSQNGRAYEDYFKTALRHFVHGSAPFLKSRKKAIDLFMQKYDIDYHELNIDSVERFFHDRKTCVQTVPKKVYHDEMYNQLLNKKRKLEQVVHKMSSVLEVVAKKDITI
jgi:hypothetical protein